MTTEQDQFWAGDFGNEYHQRNVGRIEANKNMFTEIFYKLAVACDVCPHSVIEFGAGIGENLLAISKILKEAVLVGVDVNRSAVNEMEKHSAIEYVFCMPMESYTGQKAQLSMTKGVLIHIPPERLLLAYKVLYTASSRWILICEYFNPTPVEVEYRGHAGKLWKRDFAGELLDAYKDLKLVDYGFRYHRDQYPQDDLHYFLLEKQQ